MKRDFTSGFARDLENMIALKCSLGYSENTYQERANRFDRYCEYSCAAEPPVRCGVSHLSRRNEPFYN